MTVSFMHATPADETATLEAQGWARLRPSGFTSLIGPIWTKRDGTTYRCGFVVRDKHDNTALRAHGGMIMAFCDEALGVTASASRPDTQLFTISFECQFIDGAKTGEFVEVSCEIVKSTNSLVFMRGTCTVGTRVVATCGGVWKVLGRRREQGVAGPSGERNDG